MSVKGNVLFHLLHNRSNCIIFQLYSIKIVNNDPGLGHISGVFQAR
jgi:hypothetical protein